MKEVDKAYNDEVEEDSSERIRSEVIDPTSTFLMV